MGHNKPKHRAIEGAIMKLLTLAVKDDPAWAADFMSMQSDDLREARVKIVKLESQIKALSRRLPGMFFNPTTQEWEEGNERDMAYDAPEHPQKVRIGPDDVT